MKLITTTEKGIINIVDKYFNCVCIEQGIPLDNLIEIINKKDEETVLNAVLIGQFVSYCKKCKGGGKLDWVDLIYGHKNKTKDYKASNSITFHYKFETDELSHCSTTPLLDSGEKICDSCFGCGIPFDSFAIGIQAKKYITSTGVLYSLTS